MLRCLGCNKIQSKKHQLAPEPSHSPTISEPETQLLRKIFEGLSERSFDSKLSQHNFMLFFALTGLWGEKLFRYFSGRKSGSLNEQQFLKGIGRTVRSSENEKISILFNFIKEPGQQGIKYRQFLKMLYHYSKDELKEIMVNDGVFVHEAIIPSGRTYPQAEGQCVHLKHQPPTNYTTFTNKSSFEKAYDQIMSNYEDPGTFLHFKTETLTYRVDYINMTSLTKEFASHVFRKYQIDEQLQQMREDQFRSWIKTNTKLFNSYFSAFHEELWSVNENGPAFLRHIEQECAVEIEQGSWKQQVYMILVKCVLFLCIDREQKHQIHKIICLEGLAIKLIDDRKMQIKDVPNNRTKIQITFPDRDVAVQWLRTLQNFEKDYLHTKYEVGEVIGTGRFSVVFKCCDRKTKQNFALKILDLEKLDGKAKEAIENETQIMKILKFPSTVKYYETIYTKQNIYIVTEYIYGEDLFEYVKRRKRLDEFEAAYILGKVIQAVIHIHGLDIIHRDLKPENIMISFKPEEVDTDKSSMQYEELQPKADTVKIIDFGLSNYCSAFETSEEVPIIGTPNYIAPELFLGEKPSFQNDIFSIGSILYFMLRGKFPFSCSDSASIAIRTIQSDYSLHDSIWERISDEAKDLVEMLLEPDPNERITLTDALNHPWFCRLQYAYRRKDITDPK